MSEPISKDCKHCDHLTACWKDTAGEHKRWQCCHCGRISGEYAPISRGFGDVWETGGHGPFLSQPRFAEQTGTPEAGVREARLSGWIGVDLDGTLAQYNGFVGPKHIGEPVIGMVERVQRWLEAGFDVRVFTARVCYGDSQNCRPAIEAWCRKHIGRVLPITCEKDFGMIELWDDRCVAVEPNTGKPLNLSRLESDG